MRISSQPKFYSNNFTRFPTFKKNDLNYENDYTLVFICWLFWMIIKLADNDGYNNRSKSPSAGFRQKTAGLWIMRRIFFFFFLSSQCSQGENRTDFFFFLIIFVFCLNENKIIIIIIVNATYCRALVLMRIVQPHKSTIYTTNIHCS